MTATTPPNATSAPSASPAGDSNAGTCASTPGCHIAGAIVIRLIVPAWLLAGAVFKMISMNPKLLPPPVLDAVGWAARTIGQPVTEVYEPALRAIIMAEISLALTMMLAPRLSRFLAGSVLVLFCGILIMALMSGAKDCGCFGKGGPPPWAMLGIDGALLLAVLALPMPRTTRTCTATLATAAGALVVGAAVAWTAPGIGETKIETPAEAEPAAQSDAQPAVAPPVTPPVAPPDAPSDTPAAASRAAPPATPPDVAPPAASAAPWPPSPRTAKPYYDAECKTWIGKRLDSLELPLLIQQPLPLNPNVGRLHIVFMREDCDHCHELLMKFFSQPKLPTPTLAVVVPDATGAALENPCTDCKTATLVKGGIIWMFTTPILVTVQDGVVVGACDASEAENDELVRATLNAGK